MIVYCTPVERLKAPFGIDYLDRLLFIGSCFAENIGLEMADSRFRVVVNPFGVLYNPLSVAAGCRRLVHPKPFDVGDLYYDGAMYHSFMHHGSFSRIASDDVLAAMNEALTKGGAFFRDLTCLAVTWGVASAFRLKVNGRLVANCHKLPAALFEREQLTVDRIVDTWSDLLETIWKTNPSLKVILSVSPIRYWKDGAHANQLSKATLLLAEQALTAKYPDRISYFPAYELMMDELRDYRFYADDLFHPSEVAVRYIGERFCEVYMDATTRATLKEIADIHKALRHKPFHPSTDSYKQFLNQTMLKTERLHHKYPYLCLEEVKTELTTKLQTLK
jgi:hypothetical protein